MAKESDNSDSDDNVDVVKRAKPATEVFRPFDISSDVKDIANEPPRTTQLVFSYKGGKKVPKLKEPRNLYSFCNEKGLQSAPRWPVEVKVLPIRPRHIGRAPNFAEPFYKPSPCAESQSLRCSPSSDGRLVYDNSCGPENYFMRSRVGGCRIANVPFYKLASSNDKTLIFESRFESGNLLRAIKVNEYEYELWLRNDLYTNKHTQWFYFRVQNTQPAVEYRFTIVNFLKSGSLYNNGMRPLMYSEIEATKKKIGWMRVGENIKYFRNGIRREDTNKERYYHSLTWTCEFPHEKDTCYFAHCYPYSYSDLQEYLAGISNDPVRSRICKQRVLCRTLAGNFVYILTITNPSRRPVDAEIKRSVVVTARVHPGETNSSWMMKGLLDFLTSNAPDAKLLRDMFIFKIVPMINPDGVIVGNYRCSLTGRDLNRNYKTVLKDSFPPIWHLRNMVKKLLEEREIVVYVDLHGHSKKHNVFIYGCENRFDPLKRFRERVFPVMMSKNAPAKFSYPGCKFKVQKSKDGTGRVVMWQMGILNSFTMEATFGGSSLDKKSGFHFSCEDFESMGFHLCDTLLDYCDPDDSKYIQIMLDLEQKLRAQILENLRKKGTVPASFTVIDIDLEADYPSDIESSTGGSDSSVSDGLPMHLIYAPNAMQLYQPKKKRLKSRKERNKRRAKALIVKDVLLTSLAKPAQSEPAESKIFYHKHHQKKSVHSTFKYENPRPRKHEHRESSTPMRHRLVGECCHSERVEEIAARRTDYLEAITNAYMMNGVLVTEAEDIPQLRYTAGSAQLREQSTPSKWSTASPAPAQVFHTSEDEGAFTIKYLARQLERGTDCTIPRVHSETSLGSARDMARRITMCNTRYKTPASVEPLDTQAPLLRPRTPVQPYPHYPWQPKADCLSSTKVRLYKQPRGLATKEQELGKSLSQISILEGTKKQTIPKTLEKPALVTSTSETSKPKGIGVSKTRTKRSSVDWEVQTKTFEGTFDGSKGRPQRTDNVAMRKYTGKGDPASSTDSGQLGFGLYERQPATSSFTGTMKTISPAKSTSGISSEYGRNSPVYVAVPVNSPPVKAKPKYKRSQSREEPEPGDAALSTINDLRTRLMGSGDTGALVSFALSSRESQEARRKSAASLVRASVQASSSDSDKDKDKDKDKDNDNDSDYANDQPQNTFISKYHTNYPPRENVSPLVTEDNQKSIATLVMDSGSSDLHGNEGPNKGRVYYIDTCRRSNDNSQASAPGVVNIGEGLNDEQQMLCDSNRKPQKGSKNSSSPQRTQESGPGAGATPSTISLTFQFDGVTARDSNTALHQRPSGVPPQLKHMFKAHHR